MCCLGLWLTPSRLLDTEILCTFVTMIVLAKFETASKTRRFVNLFPSKQTIMAVKDYG